jgi:hypothetical protein
VSRCYHHAADRGREPPAHHLDIGLVHLAGAMPRPQAAAVGGAEHLALAMTDHHRTGRHHDRRLIGRDRAITCAGKGLVASADHHHRVLGCARTISSVSIDIGLRMYIEVGAEALMDRDGRKLHRQPAASITPRHRLDHWHVAIGRGLRSPNRCR